MLGGKRPVWLEGSKQGREGKRKVKGAARWPDHTELFPKVPWKAVEGFYQQNEAISLMLEQDHSR